MEHAAAAAGPAAEQQALHEIHCAVVVAVMPQGIKIRLQGAPGPAIVPPEHISRTLDGVLSNGNNTDVRFRAMSRLLQQDDEVWVKIVYLDAPPLFRMECAMTMVRPLTSFAAHRS